MQNEIFGIVLMYAAVIAFAIPLGRYIGKIINDEPTWPDRLFNPVERLFFRISGIDPQVSMT